MRQKALFCSTNTLLLVTRILSKSSDPIFFITAIIINAIVNSSIKIIKKQSTFYFTSDEIVYYINHQLLHFSTQSLVLFSFAHCWIDFFFILSCILSFSVCLLQVYFLCIVFHIILFFVYLLQTYTDIDFLKTIFFLVFSSSDNSPYWSRPILVAFLCCLGNAV